MYATLLFRSHPIGALAVSDRIVSVRLITMGKNCSQDYTWILFNGFWTFQYGQPSFNFCNYSNFSNFNTHQFKDPSKITYYIGQTSSSGSASITLRRASLKMCCGTWSCCDGEAAKKVATRIGYWSMVPETRVSRSQSITLSYGAPSHHLFCESACKPFGCSLDQCISRLRCSKLLNRFHDVNSSNRLDGVWYLCNYAV